MLKTKYLVKRDFEYTPGVFLRQGDEFVPAGEPNDVKIVNASNLITIVTYEEPAAPRPAVQRRKRKGK